MFGVTHEVAHEIFRTDLGVLPINLVFVDVCEPSSLSVNRGGVLCKEVLLARHIQAIGKLLELLARESNLVATLLDNEDSILEAVENLLVILGKTDFDGVLVPNCIKREACCVGHQS